jgi:uncharacterized protein (TIGR02246 family)
MDYSPLDSPESIPSVFAEAWNNRDPDHLASLFDEDAEFVNVTGLWWHDRESIRRAHRYGLAHIFPHSTLMVRAVRGEQLSDDIAVVHAQMRLEGQAPLSGVSTPQPRHTIFSFVVHQTLDGWRCASAHNTDVVPGMETNIVDDDGRFRSVNYCDLD